MSTLAPSITLRPVAPADEEFLLALYASTRQQELALLPDARLQDAFVRQQFAAQDAHYRSYEGASFDVIELDGEAIGRLYVARWASEIRVMDVALLPAWRGRGIGSSLLRELLAEAAAAGKKVSIHVEASSAALRLYERLGFAPVAERAACLLLETRVDG